MDVPPAGRHRLRHPARWTLPAIFVGWFLLLGLWSVASPLMSGPDEPQHVINAVAVAHGQVGRPTRGDATGQLAQVDVPDYVVQERLNSCTAFRPDVTADCQSPRPSRRGTVRAYTQFNNYPPLYYAVVGMGARVTSGFSAFVALRMLSVALSAAMLTCAVAFLRWHGWRSRALLALAVGVTPMTLFLGAVVNDSGFEITAAAAVWAGALHVTGASRVSRPAAVLFAVVCLCLGGARTSDLVVLPVLVAVAAFCSRRDWWRGLGRRIVWVPLLAAELMAVSFVLAVGPPNLLGHPPAHPLGLLAAMRVSLTRLPARGGQVVGTFGWLDTPLPGPVLALWLVGFGGLVLHAVRQRAWRAVLACVALVAVAVLGSALTEAQSYDTTGLYVQARYVLPLLVGIPMLLMTAGPPSRSLLVVVLLSAVGTEVVAFQQELRRYTVGLSGPWFPLHPAWQPGLPWPVLAGAHLGLVLVVPAVVLGYRRTTTLAARFTTR